MVSPAAGRHQVCEQVAECARVSLAAAQGTSTPCKELQATSCYGWMVSPAAGRHRVTGDSHEPAWPWGSRVVSLLSQLCSPILQPRKLDVILLQSSSAAIKGNWCFCG